MIAEGAITTDNRNPDAPSDCADVDITGPHCLVDWGWPSNFTLMLLLPVMVLA